MKRYILFFGVVFASNFYMTADQSTVAFTNMDEYNQRWDKYDPVKASKSVRVSTENPFTTKKN